jgi:sarcosine oxidase, subunit alpha
MARIGNLWASGAGRSPTCARRKAQHDAVNREVKNARTNVGAAGCLDPWENAVAGRMRARFLDMLYTNMMSSLKPGPAAMG